jgi:hypothetical protein
LAPQEREALRTLAAASPQVREQVFGGSTAGFGEAPNRGDESLFSDGLQRFRSRRFFSEAVAEQPGELFTEQAARWQATVRGRLLAALGVIPSDQDRGGLMRLLKRAVTETERA